ncbi:MAG: hypothetical protein KGL39_57300 [Patescibacteria group bacterium]|nr:hypothetical protein [Patescibacteria group bacterium]
MSENDVAMSLGRTLGRVSAIAQERDEWKARAERAEQIVGAVKLLKHNARQGDLYDEHKSLLDALDSACAESA